MKWKALLVLLAVVLVASPFAAEKAVNCFKDMVTYYMIDEIVADFAERVGDEECVDYVPSPRMMRDVCWIARQRVYHAQLDTDLDTDEDRDNGWEAQIFNVILDGKKPWEVPLLPHNLLLDVVRNSLDTPEELWSVYKRHMPRALDRIKRKGLATEAVAELKRVLSFCDGSALCIIDNDDVYIYEWIARRRKEGGQELVDTWRRIVEDMIEKLEKYCR